MIATEIVLGLMCLAAFVVLFMWTRRSERDVDYAELMANTTQSEDQRRFEQLGIALSANANRGF